MLDSIWVQYILCLPWLTEFLTVPVQHGARTSSGVDNGTVISAHGAIHTPPLETAFHHGISSSVPNSLSSLVRIESLGNQSSLTESNHSPGPLKFDIHGTSAFHPHSLPEFYDGLANGVHSNSPSTLSTSINPRPPERIDSRQFCRVNSSSIELNEKGQSCCYYYYYFF